MLIRYVFCFFLLISGHFIVAQDLAIPRTLAITQDPAAAQSFMLDKELHEIDSLIQYHRLEIAQRKTDSLYQQLNAFSRRKKPKAQILELKFRQALILDRQDISSAEPLRILLQIKDEAEAEGLHSLACRIYLRIALAFEKTANYELNDQYLKLADQKIQKHKLENLYSAYCIRKSLYHRNMNQPDSTLYYTNKAKEYAERYNNEVDLMDAYLLLGSILSDQANYNEALKCRFIILNYYRKTNNTKDIHFGYNNIAITYMAMGQLSNALLYSDSAYVFYKELSVFVKYSLGETRYIIYDAMGNTDSAYYYFKQYDNDSQLLRKEEENLNTKKLEEQYQNDKREAAIKNKNRQMVLIIGLLGVIALASVLLFRKNRQINKQNKIIGRQLDELTRTLEQKQVLLSELQHRVKNNLQHVISILEIQKESVDFNNVEELIRGNQNRIHSMALLHKKLHVSDQVNEVDLKKYMIELSELVKDSYDNHKKKITLDITCGIENIAIEKAFPLGLIIVELVSNSMKHAFRKRNIGMIHIRITKDKISDQNKLYYADNGSGFDFHKTSEKGLGMEIINGLIDQLGGKTETSSNNGFELSVYFK